MRCAHARSKRFPVVVAEPSAPVVEDFDSRLLVVTIILDPLGVCTGAAVLCGVTMRSRAGLVDVTLFCLLVLWSSPMKPARNGVGVSGIPSCDETRWRFARGVEGGVVEQLEVRWTFAGTFASTSLLLSSSAVEAFVLALLVRADRLNAVVMATTLKASVLLVVVLIINCLDERSTDLWFSS